jgi:hypothetical protein
MNPTNSWRKLKCSGRISSSCPRTKNKTKTKNKQNKKNKKNQKLQ